MTTFTHFPIVRITDHSPAPGDQPHPLVGCTGQVDCIYGAYESWPSDLLYLTMLDGEKAGKTIRVFAHRCEPVPESEPQP
jgi:hypothetical protein